MSEGQMIEYVPRQYIIYGSRGYAAAGDAEEFLRSKHYEPLKLGGEWPWISYNRVMRARIVELGNAYRIEYAPAWAVLLQ